MEPNVLWAQTSDGAEVALRRFAPSGSRQAVYLSTHAMMANGRYFSAGPDDGFAGYLARAGVEVYVLDFRGHGLSKLGDRRAQWCFDDYVERDLPAAIATVCEAARIAAGDLVYGGHSLGGLVGLAAVATEAIALPRKIALWATSVWLPGPRGSRWRRWLMALFALSSRPLGRAPIRALGLGTDDEPAGYVEQLARWAHTGRFTSLSGIDYLAGLGRIRTPVWSACGLADRLCRPADAAMLLSRIPGAHPLRQVGVRCGDALDADHFTLFTRREMRPLWDEFLAFVAS